MSPMDWTKRCASIWSCMSSFEYLGPVTLYGTDTANMASFLVLCSNRPYYSADRLAGDPSASWSIRSWIYFVEVTIKVLSQHDCVARLQFHLQLSSEYNIVGLIFRPNSSDGSQSASTDKKGKTPETMWAGDCMQLLYPVFAVKVPHFPYTTAMRNSDWQEFLCSK